LAFCGTLLVIRPPKWLADALYTPWPTLFLLIAFTVGALSMHPYVVSLKEHGAGSDSDEALILAGQALLNFQNPYTAVTYLGNPFSVGPGWALLAAPFTVSGLYPLFFPSTVALTMGCLRSNGHDWLTLNRFIILLASSPCVWELACDGSDYLPFAMLTLTVTQLLQRPIIRTFDVVGLTVVLGLLSTFRIVFIFLPLLVGFSLFAIHRRRAFAVALGSLAICLASQSLFYFLNRGHYPPLNLLQNKSQAHFTSETLALAVAICAVAGVAMLLNWGRWRPITQLAIGLTIPWAIVAVSDLAVVQGSLPLWGGAAFLAWPMPFVVIALITKTDTSLESPGSTADQI
jgi:hypothetical protein